MTEITLQLAQIRLFPFRQTTGQEPYRKQNVCKSMDVADVSTQSQSTCTAHVLFEEIKK